MSRSGPKGICWEQLELSWNWTIVWHQTTEPAVPSPPHPPPPTPVAVLSARSLTHNRWHQSTWREHWQLSPSAGASSFSWSVFSSLKTHLPCLHIHETNRPITWVSSFPDFKESWQLSSIFWRGSSPHLFSVVSHKWASTVRVGQACWHGPAVWDSRLLFPDHWWQGQQPAVQHWRQHWHQDKAHQAHWHLHGLWSKWRSSPAPFQALRIPSGSCVGAKVVDSTLHPEASS